MENRSSSSTLSTTILISCYKGGPAIELCIESILKRTRRVKYEIIVFDSSGKDSQQRRYLRKQEKAGNIELITREEKTTHNTAWQILFDKSDSPWVCYLLSDIEILDSNWLRDLLELMQGPRDLGAGRFEGARLTYSLHWSAPIFHTTCILLNSRLYSLIRTKYDWSETFVDIKELEGYFCPEIFYCLPSPKHDKIFCEAGSKFAETVLFYNKHHLTMTALNDEFFEKKLKHYGSMSHPEDDFHGESAQEIKRRAIHEALTNLRLENFPEKGVNENMLKEGTAGSRRNRPGAILRRSQEQTPLKAYPKGMPLSKGV